MSHTVHSQDPYPKLELDKNFEMKWEKNAS